MSLNHRKTREPRQIQVLKDIGSRGLQSISSLAKIQQTNRTNIDSSVRVLLDIEYLEFSEYKIGQGSKERLYKITDLGMEFLSMEQSLTLEEFWRTAFLVYDKQVFKTKFPIESFFSNYEKHTLQYDFEFAPVELGITLDNLLFYHPVANNPPIGVSMLIVLSIDKPMTKKNIIKNLKGKNPLKVKITESKIEGYFQRLIHDKLIVKISNDKNPQYRISVLGFMIIMKSLDELSDLIGSDLKTNNLIIKKIIKNSQVKIPFLSESWNILRKIVDELNAPRLFNNILNKSLTHSGSFCADGVRELLIIERMMEDAFSEIIKKESRIGMNVLQYLIKEGEVEDGFFSPVRKRLLFLQIIGGVGLQEQEKIVKSVKGNEFFLDEHTEKVISNKIAFEFFTYFIDEVIREKREAGDIQNLDRVEKYHYLKVQKWNEFQKSNKEFREWFDNWMKQLVEFEKRNVKILKERHFLKV